MITQLKRKLGGSEQKISPEIKPTIRYINDNVSSESVLYTYDQNLIKKDLLKTLYLSLIFFFLIAFFYWVYQQNGQILIMKIFRL